MAKFLSLPICCVKYTHTRIYSVPALSSCCYLMSLEGVCSQTLMPFDLCRRGGKISPILFHGSNYPAGIDSPPSFWPPAAGIGSVFQGKQPCLQHLANCAPVWACGRNLTHRCQSTPPGRRHRALVAIILSAGADGCCSYK